MKTYKATEILTEIVVQFPGLYDGESEVNGTELAQALTYWLSLWNSGERKAAIVNGFIREFGGEKP